MIVRPTEHDGRLLSPAGAGGDDADGGADRGGAAPPLPAEVQLAEQLAAAMQAYLRDRGLENWQVLIGAESDLYDVDAHLPQLNEPEARWESLADHQPAPPPAQFHSRRNGQVRMQPSGVLWLRKHQVVLARWFWHARERMVWFSLVAVAVPSVEHFAALRAELVTLRRGRAKSVWQVISGQPWDDGDRIPRDTAVDWKDLILPADIRGRLELEVNSFFDDSTRQLYGEMGVAWKRGVLLHGPPGNGKTSIIRILAARNPNIPVLLLRAGRNFDDGDFTRAISSWRDQAPAILVIEDLNWLFSKVSVSTFLNLIDGVESPVDGGLLFIASTNDPASLDPAINNRPGRFDVVVELPSPAEALRLDYLTRTLKLPAEDLAALAKRGDGLSFAHLREIVQLSGLMAIRAGRAGRSAEDVRAAADVVISSHDQAKRGFPKEEVPFGLGQFRRDG